MSTTVGGIRIVDMPDLGVVTDSSSVVGENAGSGRFSMPALRNYMGGGGGGALSIKDFGARSDGATDDSAAFAAAVAAALALPHGAKVLVPAGRTVLGSAITATVPAGKTLTIEGMGPQASELYYPNNTDGLAFMLANSGTTWGAVNMHGFSMTRGPTSPPISNTALNIYADPSANKQCGPNMSFRDLSITGSVLLGNSWMNSMILNAINACSVDNVTFIGLNSIATDRGDALLTITGPGLQEFATSINIINCTMQGGSAGVLVEDYVQGVFIANSTIIGQYDSVRWIGTSATYAEELAIVNSSLNAGHRGIYMEKVNACSIAGNTILHFGTGVVAGWAGIEVNQGDFNSVTGNCLVGANTGTESGIIVSDCGYQANTVIGNTTANITGAGIYLKGTTNSATVVANSMTLGSGIVQDTQGNTFVGNTFNNSPLAQEFYQPVVFASPTAGPRWFVGNDQSAESGGNTGNNFEIVAASDGGALSLAAIAINRASSLITLLYAPKFINNPGTYTNDAAAAAGGVPVGQVYRNGSVLMVRVA